MKEATGELNGTVIVTSTVAVLAAFFFIVLWPMIKEGLKDKTTCASAICDVGYNENGMAYCYNKGDESTVFECPYRG